MVAKDAKETKILLSMREAQTLVSREMKARLGKIWKKAMQITKKTEYLPENNISIPIGHPTAKLNNAISNALKEEINATEQNITLRQVWHMDDKHGACNEKYPDQNPVTEEIFILIPNILENFDTVIEGRRTWKDNKENRSVLISKGYYDGTVILADAIIDGNRLEIKTMVVKKPTEVSPRNAKASSGSLLSPSPADLTTFNQPGLPSQGSQPVTHKYSKI